MNGIDSQSFEFAITQIDDGFVFERFASSFLSSILGYEFLPVGGLKDRGIDGLEHIFHRKGYNRHIYQMSIDKGSERKLEDTLEKLSTNKIEYDSLTLVTNQLFPDKDRAVDDLYDLYQKTIRIYDLRWFSSRVNETEGAINAFHTFVDSYLHQFNKPGKTFEFSNLVSDPRLFVFLRQQWEENRRDLQLDEVLADTLIIFSLEGTDPEKGIFRKESEMRDAMATHIKFDPKLLSDVVEKRIRVLSKKPNLKIQYHKKLDAYCLPHETRLAIRDKNLKDAALHQSFQITATEKLNSYLKSSGVRVKDELTLVEKTVHKLFYQQGLEFADFLLKGGTKEAFEKDLPDIVGRVVEESTVVGKNKNAVKTALLLTIRDIVYNGTHRQKVFLKRLSNTYMMLFLLQCDPKIATFFSSLASKLNVYVCTSIIVPALSEYYLDPFNRRHWNLLQGAHSAGVRLIINDTILEELVGHFRRIMAVYENEYSGNEQFYLSGEEYSIYINEIMIRAYFYAKRRKQVKDFNSFVDNFINPNMKNAKEGLAMWLKDEFGIEFVSDKSLAVKVDKGELDTLTEALTKQKRNKLKAKNDATIILSIFAQRADRNEITTGSIFGYRTWWLSKDSVTHATVEKVFKDRYTVSCYMRPDFLYNYISLAPSRGEVDAAYNELFPSLLGVNISSHLPADTVGIIHEYIKEHGAKKPNRLKSIMRDLAEKLKVDATSQNRQYVKHYLEEQFGR